MTTATDKAWFVRKTDEGFRAVAKNLETRREEMVGFPFPTVEAARNYIVKMWHNGTDFPGSLGFTGKPDDVVLYHCLADLC